MKVHIYGKNVSVTPGMQEKIEKKLNILNKYFLIDESVEANVVVNVHPHKQKIEVTIPTRMAILRAEVASEDLYAAIDLVINKLEDQIRRQKTRLEKRGKEGLAKAFFEEDEVMEDFDDGTDEFDDDVVRTKTITPALMDLDEAIMRMEMLGHKFFIYTDSETEDIAVVYKRNNGGYGLIETE